ncbi:MAG: hypothetical protein IH612_00145, partial [Desulfofustis sp.]|nr:hypothetical protein [Desulfofustis sp.]
MADLFADIDPWEEYEHFAQRDRTRQDNVDTKSNFSRGLASGWDQMVGMLAGGVGLAGDAVGMESVRDWGFEKYQQKNDEASLNPLDVQNFTDIESAGDAADWFTGTLGQLAPSMGEALVSTMLGGGIGGLAARKLAKEAIETAVQKQVANGVKREVAEQIVTSNFKKAGANIGMTAGVGMMEGGGMWGEDAEKHGVENANAGSAAALGLVSGASELVSPGGMLVKRIAGVKDFGSPTASKLADTFLGRLGTELPKAMGGEAAQEVFQSFLGMLNKKVNDPSVDLTDREAMLEYINSGAAGAAGGVVFGGVGAVAPQKPNRGVSDTPFNVIPPSEMYAQQLLDQYDTVDDVFADLDADRSVRRAVGAEIPPADSMFATDLSEGGEFDAQTQEIRSILSRRKANQTGNTDQNQQAFERGIGQSQLQDEQTKLENYSPDLPPNVQAGFDPLMDVWADDAVSLAQQEQQRGDKQISARALPPGQGFELVGQPTDKLSAEVQQTRTRASLRKRGDEELAPAFDRMLTQLGEGDAGGMNYDAEGAEKNQASFADSSDHITWTPSTNPEWLKLKTLKSLDKKNGTNLEKTVNRGS